MGREFYSIRLGLLLDLLFYLIDGGIEFEKFKVEVVWMDVLKGLDLASFYFGLSTGGF